MVCMKFACDCEEKGKRQNTEYRRQKTGGKREKTVNQGTGITGVGAQDSGKSGNKKDLNIEYRTPIEGIVTCKECPM